MRIPPLFVAFALISSVASAQTPVLSVDKPVWGFRGVYLQPIDLDNSQATREALRFRHGDDGRILVSVQTFAGGERRFGCTGPEFDPWEQFHVSPDGRYTETYLHLDYDDAIRRLIVQGEFGYHELAIHEPRTCVPPQTSLIPAPLPPFTTHPGFPAPARNCQTTDHRCE